MTDQAPPPLPHRRSRRWMVAGALLGFALVAALALGGAFWMARGPLASACCHRAAVSYAQGKFKAAIAEFTTAVRLNPAKANAYYGRALAYAAEGRNLEAIADLTTVIRYTPTDAKAWCARGVAHHRLGNRDQAIADHTEAIRLDPRCALAYRDRGFALMLQGKSDDALADLDTAVRLAPADAANYGARGAAHQKAGQFGLSIADYARAIDLAPENAKAHNNMAWVLATCPDGSYRNGEQTVLQATVACKLTGWKKASYVDTLAAGCAEAGDFAKAVEWQQQAISSGQASEVQRQIWQKRLALYQLGRPYRDDPGHSQARAAEGRSRMRACKPR